MNVAVIQAIVWQIRRTELRVRREMFFGQRVSGKRAKKHFPPDP